ncbi:MAG: ATP synthase F1 subunit gamma, partial [Gammaproteobacteria bacterium]|nr:ATP synthase F1 subunit gamma [Gammaproteobacteria bacterium]
MAVGKEIRTKIASIRNTQKITRAMEMVAASKMRKTQDRMQATRPYSKKIGRIIKHLAHANPEYKHPFMIERPVKAIGLIVISSDRGLCGGLNSNLFRMLLKRMRTWSEQGCELRVATIGQKASGFFNGIGAPVVAQVSRLGDAPHLESIIGVIKAMLDEHGEGRLDELHVVYNEFVNTMTQRPTVEQLVPIRAEEL